MTRTNMSLADFIAESNDQPFELINGERIRKMPTVAGHNETIHALLMRLSAHVDAHDLGMARAEGTFVLADRYDPDWVEGSRTPDVMFISAERLQAYRAAHPDWRGKPYLIVPDFVAEVVSPNDTFSKIDEKVDAYLADGVRLIWVIDPQRSKAFVFTAEGEIERPSGDDILDADDVIPGFRVKPSDLFT